MWSVRIGSAFGVPVRLDATFLLVLPAFAYVIGSRVERTADVFNAATGADLAVEALTGGPTPWLLGSVAAVGLFAGVLAHEFGHSLVAMRYGYEIESITLWIFGGVAQLAEFPKEWRREFAIAIAGPVVSVAVGVACFAGFLLAPGTAHGTRFVLGYLALLNVALAAFNMLPAFPMDGGRVLRALLGRSRPFARATEIAARIGKGLALLLGVVGVLQFDLLLVGLALFVFVAATGEARQAVTRAALDGVEVQDVMTPIDRLRVVDPDVSVETLLGRMLRERTTDYPVVDRGRPVGLVTLEHARTVDAVERPAFTVADVMERDPATIEPRTAATTALSRMREDGVARLLVVDGGTLVGLLTRSDLTTALEVLREGGDVDTVRQHTGAGVDPLQ